MHFHIFTLFPDMFPGPLGSALQGKALEKKLWSYNAINIRNYAKDKHQTVDDTPYGGGAGMVMRADIISNALSANNKAEAKRIYLSPRGRPLTQNLAAELALEQDITLLCGRYEGIDQRALDAWDFEEISVGDYILSGGEMAALVLMDTIIRLLPGVMGNTATSDEESFSSSLLEYPHYTRPKDWAAPDGTIHTVPEILQSGHHAAIKNWRLSEAEAITRLRRPDLWQAYQSTKVKREQFIQTQPGPKEI